MRRKDREQSREFAFQVLATCEYATIAMVDDDGNPYCIPITIANDEEYVYFHSAMAGTKVDVLRQNPRVCISCVGFTERQLDRFTTRYESAIVKGVAYEVLDDSEKVRALRLLCMRHIPTNMSDFDNAIDRSLARTAVFKVSIEEITGKAKK